MNPRLDRLHAYPFERLARLKAGVDAPAGLAHIAMSIGEPQHSPPAFVLDCLRDNLHRLGSYPATAGLPEFRAAAGRWLARRFGLQPGRVNPDTMVLPVNGTREALFSFVQAVVDNGPATSRPAPVVAMPNPFYQIYEGAALLAGAEPHFLNTTASTGYLPDLDAVNEDTWRRCQVLFLCSPGNPTGAVLSLDFLRRALTLAERYDFIIAADECYTEIYLDEGSPPPAQASACSPSVQGSPGGTARASHATRPPGLLQAAIAAGHDSFERCVVFHSLSKRSSVPGLRSGFVAGDPKVMSRFLLYRTYHGSAMAVPTQLASVAAWDDDAHAATNRRLYQEKFDKVIPILSDVLDVERPSGGFYLWTDIRADDERFTRDLFASQNVTVLPGSYLARGADTAAGSGSGAGAGTAAGTGDPASRSNPGAGRVRISLVPTVEQCIEAAERIREFIRGHR